MLLFHGTSGDDDVVDSIFAQGLIPTPRPWAHDATGVDLHVFACTTPIGTRGGDPIQFAQRGVYGTRQAWLVVIDLPRTDEESIHGAIANDELERYWQARAVAHSAFADPGHLRALIAAMRRTRRAGRELVQYRVRTALDGLCDGEPDAHTLVQFEQSWIRASARNKRRVAASYGLRVPDWFLNDSHYQSCMGCMHQLFEVDIVAPEAGDAVRFARAGFDRFDLATFGTYVDALDRWLAAHGDPRVASLAQLQAGYPPPRDRVPRVLWRDFVTVRPGGGETLLRKLEYLARTAVERRRESGRPVILR